jgi:hypothetical protein
MRRPVLVIVALSIAVSSLGCKALARKLAGGSRTSDYGSPPVYTPPSDGITSDDTTHASTANAAAKTSMFGGAIAKSGDWWSYTPEAPSKFSVVLPEIPKESTDNIPSALGTIPQHQAMSSRGEGAVYIIAWMDMPGTATLDAKAVLDGARDGAVSNVETGRLRSEKVIKLGGKYTGRQVVIDVSSPMPMVITGHLYLVGRRFYQQQVVVPASATGSESAPMEKFFSSLKLP